MTHKIYVSGPMTGLPNHNKEAFNAAASQLRSEGFYVMNPAENDGGNVNHTRKDYMVQDIFNVLQADEIMVLPGWQNSVGAKVEMLLAFEREIPITNYNTRRQMRDTMTILVYPAPENEDAEST